MTEQTATGHADVTEEVARLREENLRLRDQLIARDAEMGLMHGQVVELEAGAIRALHMLRRIKSIVVPGIVWRIISRLRRLATRG
jgi:tetrahydromethanopterin S-methyltransferase subunit F